MPPFLSWIDQDPKARERSNHILALFSEKESRDEMGMGTVRDALADLLFPGTSTIQTRLRYFLFVPWTYEALERSGKQGDLFLAEGRRQELRLLETFRLEPKDTGLIGSDAGASVKRLPSSVYWAGLHSWGIRRRFSGGMEEYARGFRSFHERIARLARHGGDDEEGDGPHGEGIWHRRVLELRPEGFPQSMTFRLTREESDFLVDRLRGRRQGSPPRPIRFAWHSTDSRPGTTCAGVLRENSRSDGLRTSLLESRAIYQIRGGIGRPLR